MIETLMAGLYDPRGTLSPERARELVRGALAFNGSVEVMQLGPLTVGVSGAPSGQRASDRPLCAIEGRLRFTAGPAKDQPWATEAEIADAWSAAGEKVLASARGSFLVALWDEQRRRGALARDQLGERPLMYHSGSRLAFASDYRPLLGLVTPRPAPDEIAVACWLGMCVPRNGRTFYEGVHRLPPGHVIELGDGGWTARPYWTPRYMEPAAGESDELYAGLRRELERATAATLHDVDTAGVLLSGGLDSSSVAALAAPQARAAGTDLRAYSAVFPGLEEADESAYIDESLGALGLSGTRMAVHGGSLLAGSLRYSRAWLAPDISANNFFWIDLLRQAAGEGAEVLLDGEGGDELFKTGYYLIADRLRQGRVRSARELVASFPTIAANRSRRVRWKVLAQYGLGGLLPYAFHRAWPRLRPFRPALELTGSARRLTRRQEDPWSWKRLDGPRWWAYLVEGMVHGPEGVGGPEHALRIARLAGVQRRRPLLDLDLVEHVLKLPPELGFEPWFARGHFRLAMDGALPDMVRLRRQKSFFTDVRVRSLLESDLPLAHRILGPGAEVRRFVRGEEIQRALDGPPAGASEAERGSWGFCLQHLAATELWLRVQADPDLSDEALFGATPDPARYELFPQGAAS
jgi:asparagine synthase (glutamine-hydrolysing)